MLNPTGASPGRRDNAPDHQRQVDELLAQVRAESVAVHPTNFKPAPPRPDPSGDSLDHRIAEELESIRHQLDLLGGVLVTDPVLLHRHAPQLQSIDRINQLLGHLARIVCADRKDLAVDQVTLTDLRARLQRRPSRAV